MARKSVLITKEETDALKVFEQRFNELCLTDEEAQELDREAQEKARRKQFGAGAIIVDDGSVVPIPGLREMPLG